MIAVQTEKLILLHHNLEKSAKSIRGHEHPPQMSEVKKLQRDENVGFEGINALRAPPSSLSRSILVYAQARVISLLSFAEADGGHSPHWACPGRV